MRLRYIFVGKESSFEHNKKMYVKLDWVPAPVNDETEQILRNFQDKIRQEREISLSRPQATNLSKHQYNILNHMKEHTHHHSHLW